MQVRRIAMLVAVVLVGSVWPASAQYAELSGRVTDSSDAVIVDARVSVVSKGKGLTRAATTNREGLYAMPALPPDEYVVTAEAEGFKTIRRDGVVLTVDQRAELNFTLHASGVTAEVTVKGGAGGLAGLRGSTDGSVSTVVDRQLAAELPVRGRSFSALVALAPGVAPLPGSSSSDGSEFAVNGQRSESNSLAVDGVSAPGEMGPAAMSNAAGQRFATTVTGTVNGGLSIDAVQEIRVQTSSFAAEFGRTPGAQISLVTRSGTNRLTGSVFEQFRDDRLMANDWFANSRGVTKPSVEEHQFGGSLGGPLVPSRLFFFASYEGLRLSQPQFRIADVPSIEARQQDSLIRDVLNAYPLPTGPSRSNMTAEYAAFSPLRHASDTFGLRLDYVPAPGVQVFGRYSQVPSTQENGSPLTSDTTIEQGSDSLTGGFTAAVGTGALVEVRTSHSGSDYRIAGPAHLMSWLPGVVPTPAFIAFYSGDLAGLWAGDRGDNIQSQSNAVASISYQFGEHLLKAGIDYRRVQSTDDGLYSLTADFSSLVEALSATTVTSLTVGHRFPVGATFENFSVYAQDTWKGVPRLSVTYGIRWDVNPPPSFAAGEGPLAAVSFEPLSQMKLATSRNVPLWSTDYGNVFPRLGMSYGLDARGRTVLSGGVGLFGDLAGHAAGLAARYAAGAHTQLARTDVPLPLSHDDVRGIEEANLTPPYLGLVVVVDPRMGTPRTIQWNLSVQRMIGEGQDVTVSYVGAEGDGLLQTREYSAGLNPDFAGSVFRATASGRSRYRALQVQYRSRVGSTLQSLVSYTLSESKDTESRLFVVDVGNEFAPSERDLRHSLTAAVSWQLPQPRHRSIAWLARDWGVHLMGTARSGYPFTVQKSSFDVLPSGERLLPRASLVPGVPVVIDDPEAPGGRRYNRAAFVEPPVGQQGNTGRNAFRGYAAYQVDLGLARTIPLAQGAKVRVRVDAFNVFNTPTFALPDSWDLGASTFGIPSSMAASGIGGLYRSGGPRSVALSARVEF